MEKVDQVTMSLLDSMDIGMVKLGVICLLDKYSHQEISLFLSWKWNDNDKFSPMYLIDNFGFVISQYSDYSKLIGDCIYIKDNKAIRMSARGLVYRSLGMMKVYYDFNDLEKFYL